MLNNLLFNQEVIDTLTNGELLVDNTAFVDMTRDKRECMLEFFNELRKANCTLVTIPAVFHEYTRGATSVERYNTFIELFKSLEVTTLPNVENIMRDKQNIPFEVAYGQEARNASVADRMLCTVLYHYRERNMHLLTANYKDMPGSLLRRQTFIAYDENNEIRTHALYQLADARIVNKTIRKYLG